MKKKIILGIAGGILAFVGWFVGFVAPEKLGSFNSRADAISQTATSGAVTLTTTDQRIIATSSTRTALWLSVAQSTSCSGGAYIALANDAAATSLNGIFIHASTTGMIKLEAQGMPYTGSIRGIALAGTCVLNVTGQ